MLHTRMRRPVYDRLFSLLKNHLIKGSIRKPITPECRLALTLSYLSQGTSQQFLAWSFKIGKSTTRKIILETCDVIWKILSPIYVSEPTQNNYKRIANEFWSKWNMPNCIGSLDGKHIKLKCPANSGSQYFNNKNTFSIVLLAACDAKYLFTAIDIGAFGSQSDGGVLRESAFGKKLLADSLSTPADSVLPNAEISFPHYFVGDAAFPLKKNLMRPFPGKLLNKTKRIYNYRLSRARRTIENSFGILVARWRILLTTLECSPDNSEKIVLAAVALHNFIMVNDCNLYCPQNYVDWEDDQKVLHLGEWRKEIENKGGALKSFHVRCTNSSVNALHFRDILAKYLENEGAVPFQNKILDL